MTVDSNCLEWQDQEGRLKLTRSRFQNRAPIRRVIRDRVFVPFAQARGNRSIEKIGITMRLCRGERTLMSRRGSIDYQKLRDQIVTEISNRTKLHPTARELSGVCESLLRCGREIYDLRQAL